MAFCEDLLAWYDQAKRDLPWRKTRDPYAIWVSEVMLQQTQVDTVVPYWHRFLDQFPDVATLAHSPDDPLMKAWEGLGYYARARNLRKAAQAVVTRFQGRLPANLKDLRSLPGFGPYTAAAVASIAFGVPAAAVDGNVMRVITRLRGWDDDVQKPATRKKIGTEVATLMSQDRAGDFTQALMELGATICVPRRPLCGDCPVGKACRTQGDRLPIKSKTNAAKHEILQVAVVEKGSSVLLYRRPEGLWGGLWDFPLQRHLQEMPLELIHPLLVFSHRLTHRRYTFQVTRFKGDGEAPVGEWVDRSRLGSLPLSQAGRRIVRALGDG